MTPQSASVRVSTHSRRPLPVLPHEADSAALSRETPSSQSSFQSETGAVVPVLPPVSGASDSVPPWST